MKTVELVEKEINEANTIIQTYRIIEDDLTSIEKQLEKLDEERKTLLEKLDSTRKEEEKFFKKLKKKHGEGKIDLYSMKYVVL
jgi:septation ring formation regulator EzrA